VKLPFVKYHGAGNDFILIDARFFVLQAPSLLARSLCDRRRGIGADGLLLLLPSSKANYRMQIFNVDGSEPAMCGNGIRCLFDFIQKRVDPASELLIETKQSVLRCRRVGEEIGVSLGAPQILHFPTAKESPLYVVDTGVPHAVHFVEDLDAVDVAKLGREIRFDSRFAPEGVNVNFVSILREGEIVLRTYERGVEGETLACGTGAAAAAFVAWKLGKSKSGVSVLTRSSFT